MNNGMMWFDPRPGRPNSIAAGRQPLANMCPTVLRRDGTPWLAIGAAGGRQIFPTVLQLVSYLLDRGLDLEEAFHTPRLDGSTPTLRVNAEAPPTVAAALAESFPVDVVEDTLYPVIFAIPSAVRRIDGPGGAGGRFEGMAHPPSPWAGVGRRGPARRAGMTAPSPETGAAPVLSVEGLAISVRGAPAVDGLDLAVGRGETVALVGESGCGKSLTALAVMGLLPAAAGIAAGRVTVCGEDLTALDETALQQRRGRRLAMIFQEPVSSLNPLMTVGDQVAEALVVHGRTGSADARRAALDMLEQVGIPNARPGWTSIPSNCPAHVPAGDDRHGADRRTGAADRGRTDDGARL